MEIMDIDHANSSGPEPSLSIFPTTDATQNTPPSLDPSVENSSSSEKGSAEEYLGINIPNSTPTRTVPSPREFLGPEAIQDPFPMGGKIYVLREPKTGCILGHNKRRFFLVSPAVCPGSDVNLQWSFEDITGDTTMMRLKSPWFEPGGSRWILLDVTRLRVDGRVVVSADMEMKWPAGQNKPTFKQTYVHESWKQQRDGPIKIVVEAKRGHFALGEREEAIGWEFFRVGE